MKKYAVYLALSLALVTNSAPALGQVANLQFSFSNPGARSLGLGGAFAAPADDATAAYANPAGLIQLLRPELSFEGRLWSYSTRFTAGGRIAGAPTGNLLDDTAGLREGVSFKPEVETVHAPDLWSPSNRRWGQSTRPTYPFAWDSPHGIN